MKLETKKRILIATLYASFAWPLVHYGLVRTLDLNPWNWWGWAMYTTPPRRVQASAVSTDDGLDLDMSRISRQAAQRVKAAYNAFSLERMEYGTLREPTDFARTLLEAFPDEGGVRIVVRSVLVDPRTGMVEAGSGQEFTYLRSNDD